MIHYRLCEAMLTWADANLQVLDGAAFADDDVRPGDALLAFCNPK